MLMLLVLGAVSCCFLWRVPVSCKDVESNVMLVLLLHTGIGMFASV